MVKLESILGASEVRSAIFTAGQEFFPYFKHHQYFKADIIIDSINWVSGLQKVA